MALLAPFMGIGPLSRWKRDSGQRWKELIAVPGVAAIVCALTLPIVWAGYNLWVALAVLLAGWVVLWHGQGFLVPNWGGRLAPTDPQLLGMVLAHLGFAACVVGVVATSQYSIEHDLKMAPGETETLAGYEFRFVEVAAGSRSQFRG